MKGFEIETLFESNNNTAWFAVFHSKSLQEIQGVLWLRNKNPSETPRNMKPQKSRTLGSNLESIISKDSLSFYFKSVIMDVE